jgi:ABC-2 type transport system permease protein
MRAVVALARKDLRLLLRDRVGFCFSFFFPILYAIFFGVLFAGAPDDDGGGGSAIPIVVVDEDGSEGSRELVSSIAESGHVAVEAAETAEQAASLVRRGRKTAYLVIPEGYGASADRPFFGDPARLVLGVDPARGAAGGMLRGILLEAAFRRMQKMFTDPEAGRKAVRQSIEAVEESDLEPGTRMILRTFLASLDAFLRQVPELDDGGDPTGAARGWTPVELEVKEVGREEQDRAGPRNSFEVTFPQGIVWGLMGCAAGFGISLVTERVRGTLLRLRTAPITRAEILAGKGLACFAATVGIAAALLLFGAIAFGVRPDSLPLLALAILCVACCFVGIMMLLSVVGRTEAAAAGIGWAILLVMAMIGGGMLPVFLMPPWLVTASHASPVKWSILALEGAIWRGFTLSEMFLPCGILVGVGVVAFAIGATLFRRFDG